LDIQPVILIYALRIFIFVASDIMLCGRHELTFRRTFLPRTSTVISL